MPKMNNNEGSFRDYFDLLKPKVMYLVVFTALTGMVISNGGGNWMFVLMSLLCIAMGSGGAAAINMWYDSDIDSIMKRTSLRPIPSGKIDKQTVLELGVVLSFVSVFTMVVFINLLSASVLLISILFYVFIYTMWLKRRTTQNIVIGGAAGSFPPVIGCAAMINGITIDSIILFTIVFLWTPPHFWSLSIHSCKDYAMAKVPMFPTVYGIKKTYLSIVLYTFMLVLSTIAFTVFGSGGIFYILASTILNIMFLYKIIALCYDNIMPMKVFTFSISYLFLLFTSIIVDYIIRAYV